MSDTTTTFTAVLERLKNEQNSGRVAPKINSKLSIKSIRVEVSVFQPRDLGNDTGSKENHIRGLVDAIYCNPSKVLDPIIVWWSGAGWYLLDGHHRLEAYKRVIAQKRIKIPKIPVRVFEGDLNGAMLESIRHNSKDKLPMTKDDKINRAWRLTVMQDFSKREIALTCKVGSATVSRMRRKLQELQELQPHGWQDLAFGMSWKEAQQFPRKEKSYDDEWQDNLAKDWAMRLSKAFGKQASKQPEVFARALEYYSIKLLNDLTEFLRHDIEDNGEMDF
ncbi:hypothetical protein FJM67_09795 [Maribrevibacterium harenarium]|uniref:ParB-like N-terminal domain-containing protein n=1 Tax=Maribrevibacterium harenarium TaxID=2589817 RepID=A0A501WM24_9GAMM|nr:ParB N-terminal domain-containing protein [Maribrevibacterium harenarium]TPE50853.1 hypothetical protein FJM67_09795 [Maribrevibacterium harenarium]